jgi:hypothetical protein
MIGYESIWWHDCGCFSEVFDTMEEAKRKCQREEDMGAYKTQIKKVS